MHQETTDKSDTHPTRSQERPQSQRQGYDTRRLVDVRGYNIVYGIFTVIIYIQSALDPVDANHRLFNIGYIIQNVINFILMMMSYRNIELVIYGHLLANVKSIVILYEMGYYY